MMVRWSEIYFNRDTLHGASAQAMTALFAHESGHAMLLAHNPYDLTSVMYSVVFPTAPNANDYGAYPGCANGGYGTRCIYGEGD